MNFDRNGVTQVKVKHARYGSDGASGWQLSMSTDGGFTYTLLVDTINETSTTLKTDSFAVNATNKVRLKILVTGTNRINIDDIAFKGTGDPNMFIGTPDTQGPDTVRTSMSSGLRGVIIGSDAPPVKR